MAEMVPYDETIKKTVLKYYLPLRKKVKCSMTLLFTNLYDIEYLRFLLTMTDKKVKTLDTLAFLPKPDAEQVEEYTLILTQA